MISHSQDCITLEGNKVGDQLSFINMLIAIGMLGFHVQDFQRIAFPPVVHNALGRGKITWRAIPSVPFSLSKCLNCQ